jgi:hypothetical protein
MASEPGSRFLNKIQAKGRLPVPAPYKLSDSFQRTVTPDGILKLGEIGFGSSPKDGTTQTFNPVAHAE